MLHHKSCHQIGLDTLIYNELKNIKCKKDYYLYIYDYASTKKIMDSSFYTSSNNANNTWNYNLKYEDTIKTNVMATSKLFGFGNYEYTSEDTNILVKAIGHLNASDKLGQSHIVPRSVYEETYNKTKYVGQKIIKTTDKLNIELNVYVIRNLETRELNLTFYLVKNDTTVNINRKKSKCKYFRVNEKILKDKLQNFIDYMNHINLDYGRVELLVDKDTLWYVIDINNSPGGGPLTDIAYKGIAESIRKMIALE